MYQLYVNQQNVCTLQNDEWIYC